MRSGEGKDQVRAHLGGLRRSLAGGIRPQLTDVLAGGEGAFGVAALLSAEARLRPVNETAKMGLLPFP